MPSISIQSRGRCIVAKPLTAQQRERAARKVRDGAIASLAIAEHAHGWFDGWRSSQPDISGELFKKSLRKLDVVTAARKNLEHAETAYARAIRRTERERRTK